MAMRLNTHGKNLADNGLAGTLALFHTTTSNNYLHIYKGTMPSDVTTWTDTMYQSDLLLTYTNFAGGASGTTTRITSLPSVNPVVATGTGTATWGCLFNSVYKISSWLFAEVTNDAGNGHIQLETTNIVSGNSYLFLSFGIQFIFV